MVVAVQEFGGLFLPAIIICMALSPVVAQADEVGAVITDGIEVIVR